MLTLKLGAAAILAGLVGSAALAQSPDAPLKGRDTAPNLPPPEQTIPDKIRPSEGTQSGSGDKGTLSDRLQKDDGVIKPPGNAAPGMVVRPPDTETGAMPVIKPGDLPGHEPGTEAK